MTEQPVTYFSEGTRLSATLYLPASASAAARRLIDG